MTIIFKGRLNGIQRHKAKRLLDMMYTPKELAAELGISLDVIYRGYLPLGCPHERSDKNYLSVNGRAFWNWYQKTYAKLTLAKDETFCKTCKGAVKIVNPEQKQKQDLVYLLSVCPVCGRKLTKIITSKGSIFSDK